MTLRQPRSARELPFLDRTSTGGGADATPARAPMTFSVQEESPNLGLYLCSGDLRALVEALDLPDGDRALLLGAEGPVTVPWAMVGLLDADVEVVHLPAAEPRLASGLPRSVLGDPSRALPRGSRVAISHERGGPLAVFAADRELLSRCLGVAIARYLSSVVGRPIDAPTLSPRLQDALIQPRPAGAWTRLELDVRGRYWVLSLQHGHGERGVVRERWVCEGEGGHWRAGWAW